MDEIPNRNLSPRQFGPGGKYTTRFTDMWDHPVEDGNPRKIEAVHTKSERRIGVMTWYADGFTAPADADPHAPTISHVQVSPNMRRKGVATAMLNHARDVYPNLQHSGALLDDGAAWSKARP